MEIDGELIWSGTRASFMLLHRLLSFSGFTKTPRIKIQNVWNDILSDESKKKQVRIIAERKAMCW